MQPTYRKFLVCLATLASVGCGAKQDVTPHATFPTSDSAKTAVSLVNASNPPFAGPVWFTDRSASSGIDFKHHSGDSEEKPFPAVNGSGLAALDYDLDGCYDLYFATGRPFPVDDSQGAPVNRCYRNVANWKFRDVTTQSRLGHRGYSAGLAVGDYDNDGFPDVFVSCVGPNCLFHNEGDGTFTPVKAGVEDDRWGVSAAFLDYDGDGALDLYVCNYAKWSLETNPYCGDRSKNFRHHCSPVTVDGESDLLYRNLGDGAFEEASRAAGLPERAFRGQGVVAADLNGDQRIDLYVANDLHPSLLYLNRGDGTFRDVSELSGAGYTNRGKVQAGMGVDAADFNNDGRLDLFVTNFEHESDSLYLNLGGEQFQEVGQQRGVATQSVSWIGWGTAFADFDLDGWLDLVVTNGHFDDNRHLLGEDAPHAQPPLMWNNVRGRFEFLGAAAGEYFRGQYVGRALVTSDLDNDGDQDLVIGHQDAGPVLLQNNRRPFAPGEPRSITVRLVGGVSNRDAIGGTVTLRTKDRTLVQQVKGGGSYLSSNDRRLAFAVLPEETELRFEIDWPSGLRQEFSPATAGAAYLLIESAAGPRAFPIPMTSLENRP